MQDFTVIAVAYGGYVSIIKLVAFLVLFFLSWPLIGWIYEDSESVDSNQPAWTGGMLGAIFVSVLIWLLVPIFLIGMFVYIIAVITTALVYVKHRNARVMDFDRVLTADHIKSLFSRSGEQNDEMKDTTFITANKNDVELPAPRTAEFYGYKQCFELITDAIWRRADTVAFTPAPQAYNVTYTIDGAVLKQPEIPKEQMDTLLPFLKKIADLDEKERRKPQKGNFKVRRDKEVFEWEVQTAGSTAGEQVRLVRSLSGSITKLAELGLMPEQFKMLDGLKDLKEGLFLVSGPKRTGVTTTFYALIRNHDSYTNSINTLERRTSGVIPNVIQTVYDQAKSGLSFADEFARMVRMGPDIIGIADCEDPKASQSACNGSIDQKVVYVTLEADSVITALRKWMKLVGDRKLLTAGLLGIINQRLVRMLCNECKQAYAPNKDLLRKFNINAEKTKALYRAGKVVYDKHGKPSTCENCQGTGFVGRTGVFELIMLDDHLKKVIRKAKTMQEISTQFRRAKMLLLQEQAMRKVINGTTSINEVIRVLSPPKKGAPAPRRKAAGQ